MYEKLQKKVEKILQLSSHDWDHTKRVLNLCLHIGREEGADLMILKFAALLHDIGREEEHRYKGRKCHAQIGANIASKLLKQVKMDDEMINKIIHCIETHRYRGNKKPLTLEAKILFDADKLDAIGAVGIGRAFLFAGEVGAKLHNKGVDLSKTKSYTIEDTAYREYMVKLRYIKNKLMTKFGREIAKDRHKYMREFFIRLDKEVKGMI